ncbi:uracil DNA N-glycosylase Thp1 [Oleoguttula sp. CCFEE 5521]
MESRTQTKTSEEVKMSEEVKTALQKATVEAQGLFEPQIETEMQREDESTEEVKTEPIESTFATSLQRFRHDETNGTTSSGQLPATLTPRSTRKRKREPLNLDVKPTVSPSPAKKRRTPSKYTGPEVFEHLSPLNDTLAPNLICIFVGTNPGIRTAEAGHAYAHPSNMFWKLLHSSGCTPVRLKPEQDVDLPRLYSMGNTNIVSRPSKDAAQLSKAETSAGTPILEMKIRKFRSEAVCIVGKGIWEAIWRWRYKRELRKGDFEYGWQADRERMGVCEGWEGARVFVSSSTSGLSASTKPAEKEAIWKPFGEWVQQRRRERSEADGAPG